MSSEAFALRWGIMATGAVASYFCKDLLTDPLVRQIRDIRHEIVAVASSTSKTKAVKFVEENGISEGVNTYGSYAELVADPLVDIVYVATPHSHHFQNAMLVLQAGKHVLCEKPFTVTSAQATELVRVARANSLFLMEAVWTRFLPLSVQIRDLVKSGSIGTVYRVIADISRNKNRTGALLDYDDDHRMVNTALAGGALLGLGVYSLTWVFQILYHTQPGDGKEAPLISAALQQYTTGIDETTSIICHFPAQKAMGIALTSLRVGPAIEDSETNDPCVRIQGAAGEIQVFGPAYKPLRYKVIHTKGTTKDEIIDCPIPQDEKQNWGNGTFWEADECARCIKNGRLESPTMPWHETIAIMKVMDSVLKGGGVVYPDLITNAEFAETHPLNTGKA